MPETIVSCPLCKHPVSELFDQREFRGHPVINRICTSCGFVYQSPRMTQAELDAFYADEYRQLYQGQEGPNPKDLATQKARANHLSTFFTEHGTRNTHHGTRNTEHLDIGCSAGIFLRHFQKILGTHPTGIEPGKAYREYAQSQGLTVYASLEELPAGKRFDLISLMHVIEHLPDPVGYLRNLRENVIAPDGWLLLETPNLYAHDCFETAHLTAFSPHTFRQVVEMAGFRVVAFKAHGQPRSDLIPLYLTLLAQPGKEIPGLPKPESLVALRRRLGFLWRRIATRLAPGRAWKQVG
jgi:2-polyprenyl-3-methyl-5-hydroxy-6-metoxy-1,4-benzoquinol methylase